MKPSDLVPPHIRAIAPYQPGKPISELAREIGKPEADIVKLASNENPLGMSPMAKAALGSRIDTLARYPDGSGFDLKSALARRLGVTTEQIVLGNGSNDVLELAARAFLTPDTSAVYSQHAFAVYPLAVQAAGARGIEAPALEYGHDPEAMLEAIDGDTRMVFIANPNNPTGTFVSGGDMHAFIAAVGEDVIVVLDEAYREYLPHDKRYDSAAWLHEFPNLVLTRTFSKAYGLAGLRVGYALCASEVADLLNRIRQPFNVNSLALAAAEAALEDEVFVEESRRLNDEGMTQLTAAFRRMALTYIPSRGNFVSVRVGDAARVNRRLLDAGIIVRPIANYGLPEFLRVSIGLPEENARFLAGLEAALAT
jgi:histidinol-phosphate aminotransferase